MSASAASIRDNLDRVRDRIAAACVRSGRDPKDVTLVAVTKYAEDAGVRALIDLGHQDLGESRAVEGSARAARFGGDVRWHFIGRLQTNKAAKVAGAFQFIHSLDRPELADDLEKKCAARNRILPAFVQVNVSGEPTKAGFRPDDVPAAVAAAQARPHLNVVGLMTMAPEGDPEAARPVFRRLRELAVRCGVTGLSMGMTGDFEVAIEEGATHIRVGTALFG
ncbi:MAG TPA: YggS family pyridoxal phosphate-dependent enzyme [Planctomycetota bacterium]|nr:YggS family pyridoxal phosphate-dependent enzyme [Planctomycetota bacterium]